MYWKMIRRQLSMFTNGILFTFVLPALHASLCKHLSYYVQLDKDSSIEYENNML